jgi:hypothetical protein
MSRAEEAANMAEMTDEALSGPFPAPDLTISKVLWGDDKDGLRWTTETVRVATESEMGRLLEDFAQLAERVTRDQDIVSFAKRWGALGLCQKHGLPMCHRGDGKFAPALKTMPGLGEVCPPRKKGAEYLESLDEWRQWAARARATLTLARQLRNGEPGDPAAWKIVYGSTPTDDSLATLASCFMLWQWGADLRPIVAASPAGGYLRLWLVSYPATNSKGVMDQSARLCPSIGYRGGFFGVLATHLLLATAGGPGVAHCFNPDCLTLFRARRHGQRFCDECSAGGKVSRRLSKRRARLDAKLPRVRTTF